MKEFDNLHAVLERLLGPGGCPWDREQTLKTLRAHVLEEACEVIDAIDLDDTTHIKEELGDLFFTTLFTLKMAEKEKRFTVADCLQSTADKLIHRHPHVYGTKELSTADEVVHQWDAIKSKEKGNIHRKSAVDGIPKTLSTLARAEKMFKKMAKAGRPLGEEDRKDINDLRDEESVGKALVAVIATAQKNGVSAEQALRALLAENEASFREWESHQLSPGK